MPWHTARVLLARVVPILACAAAITVACGDDASSDAERFCGRAAEQRDLIVDPPLETEAELDATLDFYRLMGDLAPIGIAEEWDRLVVAMETASTVVPGDPESEQLVAMTAYATEPAAFAVATWVRENCAVDIPITTIVPQAPTPAVTAPPATNEAGEPITPDPSGDDGSGEGGDDSG